MAEAKYQQIVKSMAEQIRKGVYPPGSKLPGYLALAREYKVSAITSNRALLELEQMGLVERRERSGTFVLDRPKMLTDVFVVMEEPLREQHLQFLDYWRGIVSRGEGAGISIQTIQTSDPKFSPRTSLDRYIGQGLVFLGSTRTAILAAVRKAGIPYVHLGSRTSEDVFVVLEDRHRTAAELVGTLIEDGYRKIGFIGNLAASNHRLARDGYLEGIQPLGLGYRYIRDATEDNIPEVTKDLLAEDLGLDALIVMGARYPIAALPVLLNHPKKIALGVLTEDSSVLQLSKIAYIGYYSQVEAGRLALDILVEIAAGKLTAPTTCHPSFQVLRPGEKSVDRKP
jgi:DNA-binding transcriptional regulator YhcF (GntR family)